MKFSLLIQLVLLSIFTAQYSCNYAQVKSKEKEHLANEFKDSSTYLVRLPLLESTYELGDDFCYVDELGDTIIPYGKYFYSYSDTIWTFGIVSVKGEGRLKMVGIDKKGAILYEIYVFDNGPDYIEEGLFRIIKNNKIGFANEFGEVVIKPQYSCAYPFSNGVAQVTYSCAEEEYQEHKAFISEDWFFINKRGEKIEKED